MTSKSTIPRTFLISSRKDPAGTLIHEELCMILKNEPGIAPYIRHLYSDERLIFLNGPSIPGDSDRIIFLSRHASERPRPVMTVHVTGNFGPADYGGTPHTLTPAASELMHALLNGLVRYAPEGYEVMYEATHHGPTDIPLPSCFIEIGSSSIEWNDRAGARAVAKTVRDALVNDTSTVIRMAGFGGTHYAQRQTEISKVTRGGFGHIMPTRDIQYLTEKMFLEVISCSQAQAIFVDGKAMSGKEERMISGFAEKYSIPVLGQGDLIRLKQLPFSDYLKIRNLVLKEAPGCSCIVHDLPHCYEPVICTIPDDLLQEVMKTAPDEFIQTLGPLPIVHLTGKGKACHSMFITDKKYSLGLSDQLISLCLTLIQDRYACSFEGDTLIIKKTRFDPKKAQRLGISPGPLYSELMAGKSILVGESMVYPDMVMTETEQRILVHKNKVNF